MMPKILPSPCTGRSDQSTEKEGNMRRRERGGTVASKEGKLKLHKQGVV